MDKRRRNSEMVDEERSTKGTASYSSRIFSWFSSVRGTIHILGPICIKNIFFTKKQKKRNTRSVFPLKIIVTRHSIASSLLFLLENQHLSSSHFLLFQPPNRHCWEKNFGTKNWFQALAKFGTKLLRGTLAWLAIVQHEQFFVCIVIEKSTV